MLYSRINSNPVVLTKNVLGLQNREDTYKNVVVVRTYNW